MIDIEKLKILTESAKYDVSCSSSGSNRKNIKGGMGNASFAGICHTFTPDGRCVSLLKILLSNNCIYDCLYCVNRRSNDVKRATATPDEICELTYNFYKRNYIEGLFLSSSIETSPDKTMELLLETVKKLRKVYCFNGYIHLKGIPNADPILIEEAGTYVDRMSFNIELPSEKSLKLLAPQKTKTSIITPMKMLCSDTLKDKHYSKRSKFLPAGQTTQMIVGASPESDSQILKLTEGLYNRFKLKRVYYSSYVPVNFNTSILPTTSKGLMREHRLYQADWLLRFYGFNADEIVDDKGFLDENYDPKCAWALRHMELFPIEINTAPIEMLLRIPGVGMKSAYRIASARKYTKLTFEDLFKMKIVLKRAKFFVTCMGKFEGVDNEKDIKKRLLLNDNNSNNYTQLSLFPNNNEIVSSVITGEI